MLTSVALGSQYWRRLSEHWPGVLRRLYPLAVSPGKFSAQPDSRVLLETAGALSQPPSDPAASRTEELIFGWGGNRPSRSPEKPFSGNSLLAPGEVAPKPTAAFARQISGQATLEFSERNFPHRSESRSQNNNKD